MERRAHVIARPNGTERPKFIIYFDVESRVIEDTHYPFLICAEFTQYRKDRKATYSSEVDYHDNKFYTSSEEYTKNDKDLRVRFWKDVDDYASKNKFVYLINHNIAYDIISTSGIPELVRHGYKVTSYFEKGMVFILKMERREGEEGKEMKTSICFISSTNFFSTSLREVGKLFGINKLEYDYDKGGLEEGIIYCQRDRQIVRVAMESFFKFVEENKLGNVAKTISGQSFNAFTTSFMSHEIFIHTSKNAIALERTSYYGGRVECGFIGTANPDKDYYKLDINSMYPYVMKESNYPTKLMSFRKYASIEDIKDAIDEGESVIASVRVRSRKPFFPYRTKDKLIFPIGEFDTVLCTPELEFAFNENCIVEVYEASFYANAPLFAGFVDFFYTERLKAKAAKDKIRDNNYKLIMNSLYGKFGQKEDITTEFDEADETKICCRMVYDADEDKTYFEKTFGGKTFRKSGEREAFNSFPAISAHVTSFARIELLKCILKADFKNVLYMDTDSLFVTKEGYERLLDQIDPARLGALKLEEISNHVIIHAPKMYTFGKNTKSKGIRTNKYIVDIKEPEKEIKDVCIVADRKLTEDELIAEIRKDYNMVSYVLQSKYIGVEKLSDDTFSCWTFPKMATFIRNGDLSTFKNKWVTKKVSGQYTKGKVTDSGDVEPWEM